MNLESKIYYSLQNLINWINKNGCIGYDPYDVKSIPVVIRLTALGNRYFIAMLLREAIFEIFYTFPVISRKILRVKPAVNAKAMGLFASSYLDLYKLTNEDQYKHQADVCLQWLKDNCVHVDQGIGWGYPFDWQSKKLIPAGTPNGVVTTACSEAFWKNYRIFRDEESLNYCISISKFLNTLPIDIIDDDKICFSYTPIFVNHVHNLNLFVAEQLLKTGLETNNEEWIDLAERAINYTISNQLPNGSFDYNGPPETPQHHCDNYHTGFVLRMLHSIWKLTNRKDVYDSLSRCYNHYLSNFFENNQIPKLMPDRKYRIDIHSCAESINCLSELGCTFPQGLITAQRVLDWTISNLQDPSGYFYYAIIKSRLTKTTFRSKIPYIRWGQAWMHKALSNYLISTNHKLV